MYVYCIQQELTAVFIDTGKILILQLKTVSLIDVEFIANN